MKLIDATMAITITGAKTKQQFLCAYRNHIIASYAWASDEAKLNRFLESVEATIKTTQAPWDFHGAAVKKAWHNIGGKGSPTLKALRALPDTGES